MRPTESIYSQRDYITITYCCTLLHVSTLSGLLLVRKHIRNV